MAEPTVKAIPLDNLNLNTHNPRHSPQPGQVETIATLANEQGTKLIRLAEDIVAWGLNPSDLPIVIGPDENGIYEVLEGNRRVAALKLLTSPDLLASIELRKTWTDKYQELYNAAGASLPTEINCTVVSSREEAYHWIRLKHTGENAGVGVVTWDGHATQRFRGSSPALHAVELVQQTNYIDDKTRRNLEKIPITTLGRLLGTPEVREALGIELENRQLILVGPREDVLRRLAFVVSQVANKEIKVSNVDTRDQRLDYAERISTMPLPTMPGGASGNGASGTGTAGTKPRKPRRVKSDRNTLIPSSFSLRITQTRINQIYHELQKLNITTFVHSCAVMFRVFIELSLDHYAEQQNISLKVPSKVSGAPAKDMTLREKIRVVTDYLESNGIRDRHQLRGIRSLYANREHVLSVDILNAYVHNKDYSPTPTDLKANWDSVESFVQALWSV